MAPMPLARRDHWLILGVGVCALALGLLVYLTARPPGHAALIPPGWRLGGGAGFGAAAGWLPSLLHPFGFTLLLAATLVPRCQDTLWAGGLWWAVDSTAECLQHPAFATPVAAWLDQVGAPALLAAFLRQGRFDPADLAATTAGVAAAVWLLWTLHPPERPHED